MQHADLVFSVIVPTYNRPRALARCLEALSRLDYPRNHYEVIIVDDGGKTPLEPVLDPFRRSLEIILLQQFNQGPASARNWGAAHARGRFIAFTDDDCSPAPDWLKMLEVRFAAVEDPVIIGGRVINALPENVFSSASQTIVDVGCVYHNRDPHKAAFCTANNLALGAQHFHTMGGFDEEFKLAASEDREFCGRWLHRGNRIVYAQEVLVYHAHALTWRTFCQQHFTYGRGILQLQQVRARHGWQTFKPDPQYYVDLLSYPFGKAVSWRSISTSALLLAAQLASAAGLVIEWIRNRREKLAYPAGV